MKTIWKYDVSPGSRTTLLNMPRGSRPLDVQVQGVLPRLWVLVDTSEPLVTTEVVVAGTGEPLGPVGDFVATFQHGPYVWHVFWREV